MIQETKLLEIVQQVHAASLDQALWPKTLDAIADLFGGGDTTFEIIEKKAFRPLFMETGRGFDLELSDAYLDHYFSISPRVRYGMAHPDWQIVHDNAILSEDEIEADEFYMDLLAPRNLRYFLAGKVLDSDGYLGVLSLQRSASQGHVDEAEIALMTRLLPSIRQAIDMRFRLKGALGHHQLVLDGLDNVDDGIVLIDRTGNILHANRLANQIFAETDGVTTRSRVLGFADYAAVALYARHLADAFSDNVPVAGKEAGGFIAVRPSGKRPYIVSDRPLRAMDMHRLYFGSAAAIVFIRDPEIYSPLDTGLLRESYSLSPTETDLAVGLDRGDTVHDVAVARGVSVNTVRGHLYALMAKMDVSRQSALIRLLRQYRQPF